IDLLPGEVHVERLTADLTRSGRLPRWVRLGPYDLDPPAMDDLAAAASDGTDATALTNSYRPMVVESDDRLQAERFLSRLVPAQPPGPAPSAIVLRYANAGKDRRPATPAGGIMNPASLGNAALASLTGDRLALYDSVLDAGRRLQPGELTTIIGRSRNVR